MTAPLEYHGINRRTQNIISPRAVYLCVCVQVWLDSNSHWFWDGNQIHCMCHENPDIDFDLHHLHSSTGFVLLWQHNLVNRLVAKSTLSSLS